MVSASINEFNFHRRPNKVSVFPAIIEIMKTPIRPAALLCLLFTCYPGSYAAKLYQCQNGDGETTFRDTPCEAQEDTLRTREMRPRESEQSSAIAEPNGPRVAGSQLQIANLTQALSSLTPIKMTVTEYYLVNGSWPASLKELGFDPRSMHNRQIRQVDILPGGKIRATLDPLFGARKHLTLHPQEAMGGTQLEWSCEVNLPAPTLARMYGSACTAEN